MAARTRLLFSLVSLGMVLGAVTNAGASPITWSYEGSVVQSFSIVPAGTPVSFTVTADPFQNFNFGLQPNEGTYLATIVASMAGVTYTVGAGFEVNHDQLTGAPQPGRTNLRELTEQTDQGFFWGGPPSFLGFADLLNSDPSSPALLMPFPNLRLQLFVPDANFNVGAARVSGHLVPEPYSGTPVLVGFAVAALQKKLRRTTAPSN